MKKDSVPASRILLVDNNVRGLTARKVILAEHGYEIATALSGEEAWDLFQKQQFDLVVTDLRMGGMDGLELIRRIRGAESAVRIVLLSGYIECMGLTTEASGADELINKSNKEVPELLRAIRRLTSQTRKRGASSQRGQTSESKRASAV